MVRFKVVRASRILLILSIILLAVVLSLVAFRLFTKRPDDAPVGGSSNFVSAEEKDEAKARMVFASSNNALKLPLDPENEPIRIEVLAPVEERRAAQSILIYHTHTHEAYEQVSDDPYEALEAWRTTDTDHSVVRVGDELAKALRKYGFDVVHDVTDHEGDALSTAYSRSIVTLESYERRFDLYIDLHRDAFVQGQPQSVMISTGEKSAQLMMLIGNGNGFDEKPYYTENHAFAAALEARINEIEPGLCKPVLVKDGRYNQHIGVFALLIEVGHNRNTLTEAINAVGPLADAIYSLMYDRPDAQLERMREEYFASINLNESRGL